MVFDLNPQIIPSTRCWDSPMRYRKLRIAWSVGWGIAAVLLILLWVRSYRIIDTVYIGWRGMRYNGYIAPDRGRLGFVLRDYDITPGSTANPLFYFHTQGVVEPNAFVPSRDPDGGIPGTRWFRFTPRGPTEDAALLVPLWIPPLLMVMLTALPWIRWSHRFNLRTLLIATTLVAVVLGLIVSALRWPAG
jgi:hypothetical protein